MVITYLLQVRNLGFVEVKIFLRSIINNIIWDSNPSVPDTTLPSLFLVASSKVNQKNQGSRGFPIVFRLNIMAAPLFPLKKDKEGLYS